MCEAAVSQSEIEPGYCFKWNDYHHHLSELAQQLLKEDCMVDVTLSVAGERIHAHRIVLCACSTLFQEILSEATEDHPTIIISDISPEDVRLIVEFSYNGMVKIPVENISNLLEAAHFLKIYGLMEVEGLYENDSVCLPDDSDDENADVQEDSNECEPKTWADEFEKTEDSGENSLTGQDNDNNVPVKTKKKRRREGGKKKNYSEEMLEAAINDVKSGQSLVDAATRNNVPRSTLYMRAKALGVHVNAVRSDYSPECIKSAIDAVINGSSFSQASDMYRIPKTVLWRRIQKEGYQIARVSDMKRSYDADRRIAAVKALERGEKLTKVALEYKIPKTTLFRDKIRLVDEGKLPESFWKKRNVENGASKKLRLEEAVTACKEGKMSQAAAAVAYHIPKTTIWRRLKQDNQKSSRGESLMKQTPPVFSTVNQTDMKIKCETNPEFALCEVPSDIPITYMNENSIPENSVIILTTDDVENYELEEQQIMVNSGSGQEYTINIETSNANFTPAES